MGALAIYTSRAPLCVFFGDGFFQKFFGLFFLRLFVSLLLSGKNAFYIMNTGLLLDVCVTNIKHSSYGSSFHSLDSPLRYKSF